jgi:hypothetical protein
VSYTESPTFSMRSSRYSFTYPVMPYKSLLALWLLSTPLVFGLATYMIRYLLGSITSSLFQESDLLTYASWAAAGVLGVFLTGMYLLAVPLVVIWIRDRFYLLSGDRVPGKTTWSSLVAEHRLFGTRNRRSMDRDDIRKLNRKLAVSISETHDR